MFKHNLLWLRDETKPRERRTLLTPAACERLMQEGYIVVVERSQNRIFSDTEYEGRGCILVKSQSWKKAPKNAIILGLKELRKDNFPLKHLHIHFAHCFKNQFGWDKQLSRWIKGRGTLLDLEFLMDDTGRRVAAFGFFAGFTGTALAIDVWCQQKLSGKTGTYPSVRPYDNEEELLSHISERLSKAVHHSQRIPRVIVIGAKGRCGKGAVAFCEKINLPTENVTLWTREETSRGGPFPKLLEYDILVNCIYLKDSIPPFLTTSILNNNKDFYLSVISDISCDPTSSLNPLPIYADNTTFDSPTVTIPLKNNHPLEVIAIDHLPSMLPRESSEHFCTELFPYLRELRDWEKSPVWSRAKELFEEKCLSVRRSQINSPL